MINKKIEKSATEIFEIVLEKVILKDEEISLDDWKMFYHYGIMNEVIKKIVCEHGGKYD